MDYKIIKEKKFRYIEVGKGQPLVLLHGLFGQLSNFDALINKFSKDYTIIAPELPLYKLPIIRTSVKSLAKFFKKFIDHKGIKNPILLGNSLGGHVALVHTLDYMDDVDKLILTGSSGLYENAFGGGYPRRGDRAFLKNRIEQTFYDPKLATDDLVDDCVELINNRENLIRILRLAKSAIRHNMEDDLHKYKLPTCLIWGKNDIITPPDVAEEFHAKMPQTDLYWIDKCGHAPMMEHPQKFNEILEEWLKKVEK